jgi:hypothetical protein
MTVPKINLITPPDRLYNSNLSFLLVKPSTKLKIQFQNTLSKIGEDVNVYVFDDIETDINWLLSVCQGVDKIVVDIDNCDQLTRHFVSLILTQHNSYYYTTDEITPWNLISRNRIYNLDWILEVLDKEDDEDEDA